MSQPRSVELAQEQAFFDNAAKHRDRKLATMSEVPAAGAHAGAAAQLRRYAQAAADAIGRADSAVAFGRTDDQSGDTLYIGRHLIRDDTAEVLVINWQAPAAAPYFRASPADPHGLSRKRMFACEGNTIQSFTEVEFTEDGVVGAPVMDEALLVELARDRTGVMRDIVATIQAAQYDLIRAPLERVLVIEGGPGTGKTAVALHRVSWLLFQYHDRLAAGDVLVIGPHPTFMRYLREVLPGLGDDQVELRDVARLAPEVRRGRSEPPEVSRLKGEARMARLLARALAARVGEPEPAERLLIGGRFVTLPGVDVARAVADCRNAPGPYADRRHLLRQRLTELVIGRRGAPTTGQDAISNLVERLWPQQSPAAFLRDLFGSRRRLHAVGGDDFGPAELDLLYRRGADRLSEEIWSAADLPLLDEADGLINGRARQYGHVVVDEAQDLSPMQLRGVARRSASGSLTVIGDLAQSTGDWSRDDWAEVTEHLPATHAIEVVPLRYGYRVPRQVYELAARLLPVAAPRVPAPQVVRDGPADPRIHRVRRQERAGRVAAVAATHADGGQFVGIVCPPRCRRELEAALAANGVPYSSAEHGELSASVNVVSPQEAKGLEFDAVVVVEPEQIVASDPRGHRLLYVALTRTTRYLDIVCVGEPVPLSVPAGPAAPPAVAPEDRHRDTRRLAAHLAGQIRGAVGPESWELVLEELGRQLRTGERPGG